MKTSIEKVKELTEKLEKGMEELRDGEKYKNYLKCMSKFPTYSCNNSLLIWMQKPDASYVAGYKAWKKNFNRTVKRGEKGIRIIAPYNIKNEVSEETADDSSKEVMESAATVRTGFMAATVFDVSQTEGDPLPEITEQLANDVKAYEALKQAIINSSEVPVSFENIRGECNGYYSPKEERIVIQANLPEAQTIKTLIHEIAHSELHNLEAMKVDKKDRNSKEVEAESVAYVVCNRFGIEADDYSFGYILGWSKEEGFKEFKESLDLIQKTALKLIGRIDAHLEEIKAIKRQKLSIKDRLAECEERKNSTMKTVSLRKKEEALLC